MYFKPLKKKISRNLDFDINRIQKAYDFAKKVHEKQKRKSGEPYIIHPVEVATIVFDIGGDENMICAALLHDAVEESKYSEDVRNQICDNFGPDVFFLVEALSKDRTISDKGKQQIEYFHRVEEALKLDISIFFLKMADLIHNMKTISSLAQEKQALWIEELKSMYLPLMSENFHKISFHHRNPYLNLMNELETVIETHAKKSEKITLPKKEKV